jgi:twitching motility two-component system response regulator PilH
MILLVEDRPATAAVLARLLKRGHLDAVAVHDGAAALRWVQTTRPRVIVLDLSLPDMSGFDVIAIVRRLPGLEGVPIVVLTGNDSATATRWARDLGADEVLIKGSLDSGHWCDVIARHAGAPGDWA